MRNQASFATQPDLAARASRIGAVQRQQKAALKLALQSRQTDWRTIITDPPPCVADLWLTELLLLVPGVGRYRVQVVTREAYHAGINLVVPAGRSSRLTREWLLENTLPHESGRRARRHYSPAKRQSVLGIDA